MKVGFLNFYEYCNNNSMFKDPSVFKYSAAPPIGDELNYHFFHLFETAKSMGIEISTIDTQPLESYDIIFFFDYPTLNNQYFKKLIESKSDNLILFLFENEIVMSDNYDKENYNYFKKVYSWNDDLVDNKKIFKYYYPNKIPKKVNFDLNKKEKLCTLISGNKFNLHPLELYSARVEAIKWFEKNHPEDFDLYGINWDRKPYITDANIWGTEEEDDLRNALPDETPYISYKGPVDSKKEAFKNYKFSICYENAKDIPGYITEKIFDSFFAGCVPIYWGAPNVTDYIPPETFIDKRKFDSYSDLYSYIKNMSDETYQDYLDSIETFITDKKIYPFSAEYFSDLVINEIQSYESSKLESRLKIMGDELKSESSKKSQIDENYKQKKQIESLKFGINDLKKNTIKLENSPNNGRILFNMLRSRFPSWYILFSRKNNGIKNIYFNIKGYKEIKKHNLLDVGYYLKNNHEIRKSRIDPILHYIYVGYKEGQKPNPQFDGNYYLNMYKDVKNLKLNPLVHYSLFGINETRKTQKEDVKLSVLAIFHDQIDTINTCIESILSQKTDFSFEIIIGDDSSKDGTWEEILKYVKEYPKLISAHRVDIKEAELYTNSQRSGINRANILKHARGEYFNFIDGDDFLTDENRFQKHIDSLEKNRDCVGCACGVSIYKKSDGNLKFDREYKDPLGLDSETKLEPSYYIRNSFLHNVSIVFRNINSSIYKDLDETCFVDTYITDYYLQYGNLYYINDPMYGYVLGDQEGAWTNIKYQERLLTILLLCSVLSKILDKFFLDIIIKYKNQIFECYRLENRDLSPKYRKLLESNQDYLLMKIFNKENSLIDKIKLNLINKLLGTIDDTSKNVLKGKLLKFLIKK